MEPTENNVTETTTQVEQPVTEIPEVVETSPVAEPVSVQTPEPIESKPEFVCTEAARPVEPIKQVPKKESFFKKHKAVYCASPTAQGMVDMFLKGGYFASKGIQV